METDGIEPLSLFFLKGVGLMVDALLNPPKRSPSRLMFWGT